ncbi:histidine phosphatase family protein [Natronomonas sp. EA1]|uniref:histidine phosphatase family protein n=1 Tax=Natronomonas sp. EA1 TaxID=3421655 RepID=UPI003EBD862A
MEVVLLRHGETAWNDEGRMQGHAPVPLNDRGREQAHAAGAWLADEYAFDRVIASDLYRTRETANLVSEYVDADVEYDANWRERSVGIYQGLTYEEMARRFPDFGMGPEAASAYQKRPENGESLVDVHERVMGGYESLEGDTTLVITHGGPIRLVLGHLKGLDIPTTMGQHSLSNCSVTTVVDGELEAENTTDWR